MKKTGEDKYQRHIRDAAGDYSVQRSRLLDNVAKAVTLLIAIVLWLYVSATNDTVIEKTFHNVPVNIQGEDALEEKNLGVLSLSKDSLSVVLKGTDTALEAITANNSLSAYVDLSNVSEADEYTLPVKFSLPSGVTLVQGGGDVVVTVDSLESRAFAVDASKIAAESWSFAESCYIDYPNATAEVDLVEVFAPSQLLNRVHDIRIVANTTLTLTDSSKVSAKVELVDESGSVINDTRITVKAYQNGTVADDGKVSGSLIRGSISVNLPLVKEKSVPVTLVDSDGILLSQVTLSPDSVTVKGSPSAVDAISTLDLGSFAAKSLNSETDGYVKSYYTLKEHPEGITAITDADGVAVNRIEASIYVGDTYTLTVPKTYVAFVGGEAALVDETVELTLRTVGDEAYFLLLESYIAEGREEVIRLVVNLTDMDLTGETSAPVTVIFSAEFEGEVYEIYKDDLPYTVKVTSIE